MVIDKVEIGARIRKIREEIYKESRQKFAERCGFSENHLGKLERGEILISINALNKICSESGVSSDYVLYGINQEKKSSVRTSINFLLDSSTKEELKMYLKCISSIKNFIQNEK